MKRLLLSFLLFYSFITTASEKSALTTVVKVESRLSGLHDIFFSSEVPNQNCAFNDRAVIDASGSEAGVDFMLAVALTAITTQQDIILYVDGCAGHAPKAVSLILIDGSN